MGLSDAPATGSTERDASRDQPRSSDAALSENAAFAINDLIQLITEAVGLGDDILVKRLDAVLRKVEVITELSRGSPRDRRKH